MADGDDADGDYGDIVFEARTDDGRRLTSILSSICMATSRKSESSSSLAWCEVTDAGLTVTVNVAQSLQAVAYVKRAGVFHNWWLAEEYRGEVPRERLEFGINLGVLAASVVLLCTFPAAARLPPLPAAFRRRPPPPPAWCATRQPVLMRAPRAQ